MRVTWVQPEDLVGHELRQAREEGKDVDAIEERWFAAGGAPAPTRGASQEPTRPGLVSLALELLDELDALPRPLAASEPEGLEAILAAAAPLGGRAPDLDRIRGAWVGRAAGCVLGKPVENIARQGIRAIAQGTGNWPVAGWFTAVGLDPGVTERWPWNRASRPTSLAENPDEVEAVLAHELGHVLSDHMTYSTALVLLARLLSGAVSDIPLAGLPLRGLYLALLEWSRAAELTCDRAAALVVGDPMVVCRVLMRMAGGTLDGLDVGAFIRQATEYVEEEDLFARRSRLALELGRTHPAAVRRVRELVKWVESGDYDRIRSGSYVRRGHEPPPSAEFDAAVRHYRERFSAMVDRTIGGVNKLSNQIASWLRRSGDDGDSGGTADDGEGGDGSFEGD